MKFIKAAFLKTWLFFFLILSGTLIGNAQCVSTFPYLEDFENGAGGWVSSGTSNSWILATPANPVINSAASGTKSWITKANGSYNNNEKSRVVSPCYDFSTLSDPFIALSVWWESEYNFDGAVLQSSTNGGTTWNNVGGFQNPINWFNANSIAGNPGANPPTQPTNPIGWSGRNNSFNGSGGWLTAQHALSGLGGKPSVLLRVAFGADGSVTDDGFAFDDVAIAERPDVNIGDSIFLCFGDTAYLDAGGAGATYTWSNGGSSQIQPVADPGIIIVTVIDTLGFFVRDTALIFVSYTQVALPPDQDMCAGDSLFINATTNPGASYLWSTGQTTQNIFALDSGTYWVQVADTVGCVKTDSINISLELPPVVYLGNDTLICIGQNLLLNAGVGPPGTSFLWNFGAITQTVLISASGNYSVTATTPLGCEASDTINVTAALTPVVNLGPDRAECGVFTLDAGNPGSFYVWSNGATTKTITTSTPGIYTVTVTNSSGCSNSDTVVITPGTGPSVNLGPDKVLCGISSLNLNAGNPGMSYIWSTGASSQTITVTGPGTFFVVVTSSDGCTASDTVVITSSPLSIDLGPNQSLCTGASILLDATNPGATYQWSTGATTSTIIVTSGGTYSVTISDATGCSLTDQITITEIAGYVANFTSPPTAELFQPVQFIDNSPAGTSGWLWKFGDGGTSSIQNPSHAYASIGTFTVTLTASNGTCSDSESKNIVITIFTDLPEDLDGFSFNLYPNPSDGNFAVDLDIPFSSEVEMTVLDLKGQEILRKGLGNGSSFSEKIDLDKAAPGVYLLRFSMEEGSLTRKLIIR